MFGYVTPVKDKLRPQDFLLYRAFYCGTCVTLKEYGTLPRFTTSYDIAFLSALVHDVCSMKVEFIEATCVGNPFKKKLMIKTNGLLKRVAAANIIMSWYKASDDCIDEGGIKKRIARSCLKKAYKKAKAELPKADEVFNLGYARLREMEKSGEKSIDKVADCFAVMLRELCAIVVEEKADDNFRSLCYNIGKFVYLIDALDDIDEDAKKKNYNPFLFLYGDFTDRRSFYKAHEEDLNFTLSSTVNRAIESFNKMKFTQSYSLLSNIVYYGLREKVKEVLGSEKKLPAPKI